ncbi:MAG: type II toxin-antitoxin system RelE/ParE family toxin [Candidatus Omnitrophica bacterium]|nr:type II toxin-antitoxin system RelE/ParE family toxin [Candidatus Omnitrophota bacterium]
MEIMKYTLIYHPDIKKEDLPPIPANIRQRIKHAIETRLLNDPVKFGVPLRRSLKGSRKLRVGDYRIIYRLKKNTILILKIGHRKEVYYQFEKRAIS